MITKQIALTQPRELLHVTMKNKDGTPLRVRSNGMCKTWKRSPDKFELPVKYGLYQYAKITNDNAHEWCLPERHMIERHYR
jgi:hypothetical protein